MGGTIFFINAGPGDPELLTLRGRQVIDSADVIVYAASHVNSALLNGAHPDAAVHDSSVLGMQQVVDIMIEAARRNKIVARLHAGDSSLCRAIAEQIALVRDAGVDCSVVPGVSLVPEADYPDSLRIVPGGKQEGMAVVALTRRGWHTGMRILDAFEGAELFLPERFQTGDHSRISFYKESGSLLGSLFQTRSQLVLIMAVGNAVRMLAPYFGQTRHYPAVITLDDGGRNIISLLAGHWGAANTLASDVARVLGGNPVMTTESDVMGFPAVDMLIRHVTGELAQKDLPAFKCIQASILDGEQVGFYPPDLEAACNMQGHAHLHFYDSLEDLVAGDCAAALIVSHHQAVLPGCADNFVHVHPRDLIIGIECHRGAAAAEIEQAVRNIFTEQNLALQSIAAICTIDHNRDEDGLIEFSARMGVPLEFFSAAAINKIAIVPADIKAARAVPGVPEVAESAALLGSSGGNLLVSKTELEAITIAVAARSLRQILQDSGAESDVC